jgi:hypothetical protein
MADALRRLRWRQHERLVFRFNAAFTANYVLEDVALTPAIRNFIESTGHGMVIARLMEDSANFEGFGQFGHDSER